MFKTSMNHLCGIAQKSSESYLPPLSPKANFLQKFRRSIKKIILISDRNPKSYKFFQSSSAIADERKKQVKTGSWIIHPFSTFRLFYEMWMAVVFFIALIYMPLDAAYQYVMGDFIPLRVLENCLSVACTFDIYINFRTGFVLPSSEVEMRSSRIAKRYITTYFIFDFLSSFPEIKHQANFNRLTDYLGLLKIVRLFTFVKYMKRTLHYFRIKTFNFNLVVTVLLVTHYCSCLLFFIPLIYISFALGEEKLEEYKMNETHTTSSSFQEFLSIYIEDLYESASYLLSIEKSFMFTDPWITYFYLIFVYIFGKFFIAYVTVELVEYYTLSNCVENKYYAMMSQVDAYMDANSFPLGLRTRMHKYYEYKYQSKYLNENRVNKYISDKLRKEIKYHTCRAMLENVAFFKNIPQTIMENITIYLKKEIYLPRDIIIKAGVTGDCMYFLSSGTVSVSSLSGKEICHLQDGDYFGEICLILADHKTTATVTALEMCEVYKLERKAFKKCLEHEKALYNKIHADAKRRYILAKKIEKRT